MGYKTKTRGRPPNHGMVDTPTYHAWVDAKQRCNNSKNSGYHNYGGRGIEMRLTFEEFLDEVGERPEGGLSIDRINNDGHYERGNLRWATWTEQANNRRITIMGYKTESGLNQQKMRAVRDFVVKEKTIPEIAVTVERGVLTVSSWFLLPEVKAEVNRLKKILRAPNETLNEKAPNEKAKTSQPEPPLRPTETGPDPLAAFSADDLERLANA